MQSLYTSQYSQTISAFSQLSLTNQQFQSQYHYHPIFMIFLLLLLLGPSLAAACPESVTSELELIALPLECFHKLYDSAKFDGHRISRVVNERIETYRRMLQQIKMSDTQYVQTSPVAKWAQNQAQIFISFKLSHRQDSPTCSDIRSQKFQTSAVNATDGNIQYETFQTETNYSSFTYKGECFFTNQKFLFTLNISFEALLSNLTLRKEGLGQYTLVGDKVQKAIWSKPFTNHLKAAIWPQMRRKHSTDMDKYFELTVNESESSSKGKKRRRPKREKENDQIPQNMQNNAEL